MKKIFTNMEIFHFFEKNLRILLFLFQEEILIKEKKLLTIIQNRFSNYLQYLFPEDKFKNDQERKCFDDKRYVGENDSYLCELIRNDNVEEFIIYVNQTNYPLEEKIPPSIFETNYFLYNSPTLIEYAAFFGSIQIVQYLIMNNVKVKPSLLIYTVHSNNEELYHLLEEKVIYSKNSNWDVCLIESIKCHHFNFMNYFDENFVSNKFFMMKSMKYYNFQYICNHLFEINLTTLNDHYKYNFYNEIMKKSNEDIFTVQKKKFMHYCVEYDFIEIAHNLLPYCKNEINAKYKNEGEKTLLYIAVEKENYDIIKLLLSCKELDVNIESIIYKISSFSFSIEKNEMTPLHIAIQNQNVDIVNLLLTKNIEIGKNAKISGIEKTTMKLAFEHNQHNIIKSLLSYVNLNEVIKYYAEKKYDEGILYVASFIRKSSYNQK